MRCKLCHEESDLRHSHIIPEFLYTTLYDEKHKYFVGSTVRGKLARQLQKGLRERLLCGGCEARFSRVETYAANVLYHKNQGARVASDDTAVVYSVDYRKFKLFLLSIIWRIGVSSLPFFRETDLGPHEDKLRTMLLSGKPGPPERYGAFIFTITLDGKPLEGAIYGPEKHRIGNHRCYRMFVRTFLLVYFISSHPPDDMARKFMLTENGRLIMPIMELDDVPFLHSMCRDLAAATGGQGT